MFNTDVSMMASKQIFGLGQKKKIVIVWLYTSLYFFLPLNKVKHCKQFLVLLAPQIKYLEQCLTVI